MKIMVFQSKIGSGSLTWENGNSYDGNNKKIVQNCMESVSDWCKKKGFEHKVVTKDLGWNFQFKSKNDYQLNKLLQNWQHIPKSGYDYVIYLDNDVFILDQDAEPPILDFGMVPRIGDQVLFAEYYLGKNTKWFNSGVIIMSRKRCNHFSNWMLSKIMEQSWSKLFLNLPREESLTTEYCSLFQPEILDFSWNTMPPQTPKPMFKFAKFLHLLGPSKSKTLELCSKTIQKKVMKDRQEGFRISS